MVYPIKTKEAVIKKVLMGGKPHHEIASEAGIGRSTLTYCLIVRQLPRLKPKPIKKESNIAFTQASKVTRAR